MHTLATQLNLITHGPNDLELKVAGCTVAQVEEALWEILNLGPGVLCYVDEVLVLDKENLVLGVGVSVFFLKPFGFKGSDEFFSMTCKQAAELFGVSDETIRRWIHNGKLRGTKSPLRTSLRACRELRDQLLVQPPPPADTGKPRPYGRRDRKAWEFIDPDKSGTK